jgi:hypothetical protein
MLEVNPKKRLNVPQILEHPWFYDVDDDGKL